MESFYDFYVKNEKTSLLDEWDSIENEIIPKDILPKSNKSVWLKCRYAVIKMRTIMQIKL